MFDIRYEIKTYSINNPSNFKTRIADDILISDIDYTWTLNWGQWDIQIQIADIDDSDFLINDVIEVQLFRKEYLDQHFQVIWIQGILTESDVQITTEQDEDIILDWWLDDINQFTGFKIYRWVIKKITKDYLENQCTITLTCYGLFTLLNNILYRSTAISPTWPLFFTQEDKPGEIIKDIIDYFQTFYDPSLIFYNDTFIDVDWDDISVEFSANSCLEAINIVQQTSGKFYYFDSYGSIRFWDIDSFYNHVLTYEKDVSRVEIENNWVQLLNKIRIEDGSDFYETQDLTSQWTYGIAETYDKIDAGNLSPGQSLSRITDIADNRIADFKDPVRSITIRVNNNYPIETIWPWHTVSVRNFSETIENAQIKSINYTTDFVDITLERLNTTGFSLLSI